MDPKIINLTTFTAAALAVIGIFSIASDLVLRKRARIKDRIRDQFGVGADGQARKLDFLKDLKLLQSETSRRAPLLWQRFSAAVAQSGLQVEPERIMQISGTAALLGAVLGITLTRLWPVSLAAAIVGFVGPLIYVSMARAARIQALRMQLPEAFELMSRAVRAGQTMSGAMGLVATQLKPPVSEEFACCCEQQNFGLPREVTLQELARRTGVVELQLFVVAMLVHGTSGGNPVEILDNLSDVIRTRVRLIGKVKALTSEGRLQAVILSILPVGAFVAIFILNRSYAQLLLDRPRLLLTVLVFEALGALWIRRIVNFEY
ncbi:MAG TPA: type II secretion system F family protein [Planctomycetaceae bacterium]|jgi:tight adherence protein B|nr:type II secretion system F family protein [Planctomycetaceae bacterium]